MRKWKISLTKNVTKGQLRGELIPNNEGLIHQFPLPNGAILEFFVFDSAVTTTLGVTTFINTVAIHKIVAEQPHLLKVVAIHEAAHTKQWYKYLFAIVSLIGFMWLSLSVYYGDQVASTDIQKTMWFVLLLVLFAMTCMVQSWFLEYKANVTVINNIGIGCFETSFAELYRLMNLTKAQRVTRFFTHPPVRSYVWLYKLTHR